MEEIKKSSSIWIKQQDQRLTEFSWQAGYGVFSLGESQLGQLTTYIQNQRAHHRHRSFEDELLDILEKYGVAYNEQYLWD